MESLRYIDIFSTKFEISIFLTFLKLCIRWELSPLVQFSSETRKKFQIIILVFQSVQMNFFDELRQISPHWMSSNKLTKINSLLKRGGWGFFLKIYSISLLTLCKSGVIRKQIKISRDKSSFSDKSISGKCELTVSYSGNLFSSYAVPYQTCLLETSYFM